LKSVWNIRYEIALDTLRRYAVRNNKSISSVNIAELRNAVMNTYNLNPSTNNFRLYPFNGNFSVNDLISYLYAITNDSNFINTALTYLEDITKNIDVMYQIEEEALRRTEKIGRMYLAIISSSGFIENVTREIIIPDDIEVNKSSIDFTSGIIKNKPIIKINNNNDQYSDTDVGIRIIPGSNKSKYTYSISKNKTDFLKKVNPLPISVIITSNVLDTYGVEFTINTRFTNAGKIGVDLESSLRGSIIKVEGKPIGYAPFKTLTEILINQERVDIDTTEAMERLRITLTKTFPDISYDDSVLYKIQIDSISNENVINEETSVMISKPLELPDGTEYVGVVAEEHNYSNNIIYNIALLETEVYDDSDLEWFRMTPTNRLKELDITNITELPEESFLNTSTGKVFTTIIPTLRTPTLLSEKLFYNILEGKNLVLNDKISVVNGKIIESEDTIIEKILLTDGYNDWKVVKDYPSERSFESNIRHTLYTPTDSNGNDTKWYNEFNLCELYDISIIPENDTNTVSVEYEIVEYENIRIVDDNGKNLTGLINEVTESGGIYTATLNTILLSGKRYTIYLPIKIRPQVVIDEESLSLTIRNEPLVRGVDYLYSPLKQTIQLLTDGVVKTDRSVIVINYYKTYTESTAYIYYQTWIYLTAIKTIKIVSFTQLEYTKGNFHKVNGIDVSLQTEITVDPGWVFIETTQPEPLLSKLGVVENNLLTELYSEASIDLTGIEKYAVRDYMTNISLAELELSTTSDIMTQYSYIDGEIIIPRKVSNLNKGEINNGTGIYTTGKYFRGKTLSADKTTYNVINETFEIGIKYRSSGSKKYAIIKVDLLNNNVIAPNIAKLGLVPIRSFDE